MIEQMARLSVYRELRRAARKVVDEGGYDLSSGEMNPMILRWFGLKLSPRSRVWEPFANPDGRSFKIADELKLKLLSSSLVEGHPDIIIGDSTLESPEGMFDGVLFHPPYFGTRPFTEDDKDLSNAKSEIDWKIEVETAVNTVFSKLNPGGLVCAVGRRYRHGGKEIRMDECFVEMFGRTMSCIDVWLSEPDIVLIFRKEV